MIFLRLDRFPFRVFLLCGGWWVCIRSFLFFFFFFPVLIRRCDLAFWRFSAMIRLGGYIPAN